MSYVRFNKKLFMSHYVINGKEPASQPSYYIIEEFDNGYLCSSVNPKQVDILTGGSIVHISKEAVK